MEVGWFSQPSKNAEVQPDKMVHEWVKRPYSAHMEFYPEIVSIAKAA